MENLYEGYNSEDFQDDSTDRMSATLKYLNESVEMDEDPKPENVENTKKVGGIVECAEEVGGTSKVDDIIDEEYEYDEEDDEKKLQESDGDDDDDDDDDEEGDLDECNMEGYEEEQEISEKFLREYMSLKSGGKLTEARNLAESTEHFITESTDDDGEYAIAERFVVKVVGGKKIKKKVRTRKMRRTAKQKSAMKKARRVASTTGKVKANKKRKKSMKVRKKLGLSDSVIHSMRESLSHMYESRGFSRLQAKAMINESIRIFEEVGEDFTDIATEISNIFNNKGFTVDNSQIVGEDDGIVEIKVTVKDNDTTIYLDELVDEIAENLDADVEVEEPNAVDADNGLYEMTFYVDTSGGDFEDADEYETEDDSLSESYHQRGKGHKTIAEALGFNPMNESSNVVLSGKEGYVSENSEGSDVKYVDDPKKAMVFENDEDANAYIDRYKLESNDFTARILDECDMFKPAEDKKNESLKLSERLAESYKPVSRVNPKYLTEGLIYDKSEDTVLKILESNGNNDFTVEVIDTVNESLKDLKGVVVHLSESTQDYFLVRSNKK